MTITTATITRPKKCDFCPKQAEYDFKTNQGPWAYGCEEHYLTNRYFRDLGTGKGQKLVVQG